MSERLITYTVQFAIPNPTPEKAKIITEIMDKELSEFLPRFKAALAEKGLTYGKGTFSVVE